MGICEFSVNMLNKCGSCKHFKKNEQNDFYGECINDEARIKNRTCRSEMTKACSWQERK